MRVEHAYQNDTTLQLFFPAGTLLATSCISQSEREVYARVRALECTRVCRVQTLASSLSCQYGKLSKMHAPAVYIH